VPEVASGSYREREKAFNCYQAPRTWWQLVLPAEGQAGDIYRHVIEYPNGKLAGGRRLFFTGKKSTSDRNPRARIQSHVDDLSAGLRPGQTADPSNKPALFHALHAGGLQMYYCLPAEQAWQTRILPDRELNDSRLPDFGGLKLCRGPQG